MTMSTTVYRPSWKNPNKYTIYLKYFSQYIRHGDFKSLRASIRYVFTHRLPSEDFMASSWMGKFHIRKNTTDFQFINYAYEKEIKDYLKANIDNFDVFIDAGACIGEYAIWLAGLGKRCFAIEPVNHSGLARNVELNGLLDKVQVFKCGLGSKHERVFFEIPTGVTSSSHIDRNDTREPNVDIERLDDLLPKFGLRPEDRIMMKMDVEGMECELINGAREFFRQFPQITIIYEHFPEDDFMIDKQLKTVASFKFQDIDKVNRLAVKTGPL